MSIRITEAGASLSWGKRFRPRGLNLFVFWSTEKCGGTVGCSALLCSAVGLGGVQLQAFLVVSCSPLYVFPSRILLLAASVAVWSDLVFFCLPFFFPFRPFPFLSFIRPLTVSLPLSLPVASSLWCHPAFLWCGAAGLYLTLDISSHGAWLLESFLTLFLMLLVSSLVSDNRGAVLYIGSAVFLPEAVLCALLRR